MHLRLPDRVTILITLNKAHEVCDVLKNTFFFGSVLHCLWTGSAFSGLRRPSTPENAQSEQHTHPARQTRQGL
jgi:hypothetical protein